MVGFKYSLALLFALIALTWAHSDRPAKRTYAKFGPLESQAYCNAATGFSDALRIEIQQKASQVSKIMALVLNGTERHSTYDELAIFCDTFGPRMSGTESLASAIKYMAAKMSSSSDESRLESVMVPRWEVGEQWAEITSPVKHRMSILALGTSVGTGGQPVEAEVVLVHSFDELDKLGLAGGVKNKIVVYNYNFTAYGESVKYRQQGALRAAKYGARAALVRSVTPFSIYSGHAGAGSKSIPTAAITTEDADLIQRWTNRGKKLKMSLLIEARNYDDAESFNIVADLKGSEKPDEIVLVSGHIDSWYNTQGAMDDGGGMMISYKALDILKKLNLRARRTIRAVLWTAEEFGLYGARQYVQTHERELKQFKVVMESDMGTFKPLGLSYINASPQLRCILAELLKLLAPIGTDKLDNNYEGSDIEVFTDHGTAGLSLLNENSKYFYYHHTAGDTVSVEDPDDLDRSTILWAVASYILADLSVDFASQA